MALVEALTAVPFARLAANGLDSSPGVDAIASQLRRREDLATVKNEHHLSSQGTSSA
jgi:hypothetical protein